MNSGMASGAHAILIPEVKVSMDEVCQWVKEVHDRGRSPLVVVAEGFIPEGSDEVMANKGTEKDGRPRLGGIGEYITHEIETRLSHQLVELRGEPPHKILCRASRLPPTRVRFVWDAPDATSAE